MTTLGIFIHCFTLIYCTLNSVACRCGGSRRPRRNTQTTKQSASAYAVRLRPHTSHHNEEFVAQNGTRQISVVRRTLQYTRPPPATVRGTVPGAGPRVYTVLLG